MNKLLFGTGGAPHSSKTLTTLDGIRRIAELGLGCMELEFVYGVRMNEAGARLTAELAEQEGITLTAHAPYYINLNSREPEKITASQERLLQAARIASICGAWSVVFHAAFYMKDEPETVYPVVKKYLQEVVEKLRKEKISITIRPEVMGKPSQFGTIDETLQLASEIEGVAPCVDFAHWHARGGEFNSYPEFTAVLEKIKTRLGRQSLDNMHIHFSGINYGARGEKNHLNFEDADLNYKELLQALKDYDVKGTVICESPNLELDAQLLQKTYQGLKKKT